MTLSCFAVARNSILPRFEKFVRRCDANGLSANLPTNREARELWKVYRVAKHEAGRTVYYIKVIIKSKLLWPLECSKVLLPLLVGGRLDGGCLTILYNRHVDHSLGA